MEYIVKYIHRKQASIQGMELTAAMGKLNLIIMDRDVRYMNNFAVYVMENYRHRFNVEVFTAFDAFVEYMQAHSSQSDIYLADSGLCANLEKMLNAGLLIELLGGSRQSAGASANGALPAPDSAANPNENSASGTDGHSSGNCAERAAPESGAGSAADCAANAANAANAAANAAAICAAYSAARAAGG
jgi:hypothetical protein